MTNTTTLSLGKSGPQVFPLALGCMGMSGVYGKTTDDEGIATMGAWRVLRGEVPYRDFFAIETPLSFYVIAPLYALFGVSFTVGRVVAQILGIAMVLSVFRLSRRLIPSPVFAALPLAFLCQAGIGIFPFAKSTS
jgi:hypothetical protein